MHILGHLPKNNQTGDPLLDVIGLMDYAPLLVGGQWMWIDSEDLSIRACTGSSRRSSPALSNEAPLGLGQRASIPPTCIRIERAPN